ncbi:MAG: leucine-rich repeat protein, partial [Saccharofermentans sp.]|nr:leucine-rich repeat protein [Saccharofermentans sp.]
LTQDITAGTGDGPLVVTGTVKLDLNGYVIDRNLKTATSNGGVIFVDENGNLTINDSRPEATHSPVIKYQDLTTGNDVVVKGGIITGGYAQGYAGGIRFYYSSGTMNGGTIVGNKATNDNGFENAGGVLLYCSDFTINGGTICGNEAVFNGGKTNNIAAGVSITNLQGRPCNLNVNSGTITSNYTNTTEACCIGGIYNHASSISVSGKAYIYGNMKNGKDNNVCAENNYNDSYSARVVRLSGKLTDGARIGVTTWRIPSYSYRPEEFTSGFSTYNQGEHPSKYFSLDDETAIMVFDDSGEAKVALKFTITLSDDGNGSASVTPTDIYYDLHPTLVATPNQGYVFKEWQVLSGKATISNDNRIFVDAEDPNNPVTDIKIKAVFEKQKFNVTFVDGTATLGTVAVVAGEKVTKPTDPVKDGYRFDGWYEEPSFDHQFDFDTAINKETTVYANFIQEFSITVTSGSADMAKAIAGEVVTITAGAAPSGYVFDKWVWVTVPGTVAIADPAATVTSFNMPAGNVEIKATYKVKSGTCGDGSSNLTWEIDYTTGTLTISGTGKMADWGDVDSVPWYPARDSIKSVVIADGVTSIGDRAFNGYSNLEDVTISDTVTSIGHWAFSKCIGIENIELPENLSTIYSGAFNGCTGIKSISIPDKAASVSDNAFKDCTNLESVSINRDVFRPEEFSGCTSAVFHFYYDVKYTSVGNGTVDGKTRTFGTDIIALQVTAQDGYVVDKITWTSADQTVVLSPDGNGNFVMPDSDNPAEITVLFKPAGTEVVNEFIYQITNPAIDGTGTVTLKGIVTPAAAVSVPATVDINGITYKVNRIGTKAFYNDKTIKTLYIGSNVVTIDSYAFYGCSNMTKVSGGYRLQTLGTSAFAYCSKLSSFTITSSVLKKIGNYAFNKDKKLKTIYIRKTTKLSKSGVKKSLKGSSVKTVKVKKSKVKKYKKYFKKSNSGRKVKVKK